jgi:hypothetical protein
LRIGLVAFSAVASQNVVGFSNEPLCLSDAGAKVGLTSFDFGGLAVAALRPIFSCGHER